MPHTSQIPQVFIIAALLFGLIIMIASILMPLAVLRISANVLKMRKEFMKEKDILSANLVKIQNEIKRNNELLENFLDSLQAE